MRLLLFLFLLPRSVFAESSKVEETEGWESVSNDEGIEVWQRPVEGSSLVEFRGKTVFDVGVKTILAVLHDDKRKTEWMQNCVENRIVRAWEVGRRRVYNRIGSDWPFIDDRDVVVETKLDWWPEKRRILIRASNATDELAPEIDGVVRMPKLDLSWELVVVGVDKTQVTYQVKADPGGSIPKWLVNLVSKAIPHHTLANLRTQVKKDYDASLAIVEASFDWTTVGL